MFLPISVLFNALARGDCLWTAVCKSKSTG